MEHGTCLDGTGRRDGPQSKMPRKPHGKPLKPFPVRVDEDVRAALKKLARQHPTVNEGLRDLLMITPYPDAKPKPVVTRTLRKLYY